ASDGRGMDDLVAAIDGHDAWIDRSGARQERRRQGLRLRLHDILRARVMERLASGAPRQALEDWEEKVAARGVDPHTAAAALLEGDGGAVLDHIGVAVRRLEERLPFYRDLLGLVHAGTEEVETEGVRAAFLPAGRTRIELLEPSREDATLARHLERRGEGVHHLCFEVNDLDASLRRLEAAGHEVVGGGARPGAEGSRVAFLHPGKTGGVLIELRTRATMNGAKR